MLRQCFKTMKSSRRTGLPHRSSPCSCLETFSSSLSWRLRSRTPAHTSFGNPRWLLGVDRASIAFTDPMHWLLFCVETAFDTPLSFCVKVHAPTFF